MEKKEKRVFSPLKITAQLKYYGQAISKTEAFLFYASVFLVTLILCILYGLQLPYIIISIAIGAFFVPQIIMDSKKIQYEKQRFEDINSYMSQMAQSFIRNGKILESLKEARETFTKGRMREVLTAAIQHIEQASSNIRKAHREGLAIIEKQYDCERLQVLHEFLARADMRGGKCETEFELLEELRGVWETVVKQYAKKWSIVRILVMAEYIALILICIFILGKFPEDLSIINITAVQVANMAQIICFVLLFKSLNHKLSRSLLEKQKGMDKGKADKAFAYIYNFNPSAELKKNLPFVFLAVVVFALLFLLKREPAILTVGIFFLVVILNMHKISYHLTIFQLKTEMKKAFPKWLFDLLLLLQSESVDVAILKSIETAPPVLQDELWRMTKMLEDGKDAADAYMSFLAGFSIPGVENVMRKLYSLSRGTAGAGEMNILIHSNMSWLADAEKQSINNKGDLTAVYTFLPTLPVILSTIVYIAALLMVVFENVIQVL